MTKSSIVLNGFTENAFPHVAHGVRRIPTPIHKSMIVSPAAREVGTSLLADTVLRTRSYAQPPKPEGQGCDALA